LNEKSRYTFVSVINFSTEGRIDEKETFDIIVEVDVTVSVPEIAIKSNT
jgi:hypothetical protein